MTKGLPWCALLVACVGCASSPGDAGEAGPSSTGSPPDDPVVADGACRDALAAIGLVPEGLPPFDASRRGDVVVCAREDHASLEAVKKTLRGDDVSDDPAVTGVTSYVFAYRTLRMDGAREATSIAGARLLVPDAPRSRDAVVLWGHGTIGLAPTCAADVDTNVTMPLSAAAHGYITVVPAYPGFGYGAAPQGWLNGDDESRAVFDALRSLGHLLAKPTLRAVLLGHSEGAHAVMAAQGRAATEGGVPAIAGVVVFAPMWFPERAFADVIAGAPPKEDGGGAKDLSWAMDYFFGHGELLDGAGEGVPEVKPALRVEYGELIGRKCSEDVDAHLKGRHASDLFDATFAADVRACASGGACTGASTPWAARMATDRGPLDRAGAPVLLWAGGADANVVPARARCAIDALEADLDAPSRRVCIAEAESHVGLPKATIGLSLAWIDARLGGADAADIPIASDLCQPAEALAAACPY